MRIEISAETQSMTDMAVVLRKIAEEIDAGNLNGLKPIWRLYGPDIDALWNGPTMEKKNENQSTTDSTNSKFEPVPAQGD